MFCHWHLNFANSSKKEKKKKAQEVIAPRHKVSITAATSDSHTLRKAEARSGSVESLEKQITFLFNAPSDFWTLSQTLILKDSRLVETCSDVLY